MKEKTDRDRNRDRDRGKNDFLPVEWEVSLVPTSFWRPELSMLGKTKTFLEMIKFSHSVFALPFALISMLLAAGGWPERRTIVWIIVAVVGARTAAMCFNRLTDRELDARNPRTQKRALVTGALDKEFAVAALLIASGVFFLAAGMLGWLCLFLAPPCLAILLAYSFTKRVTRYCHFWLGASLGLAPLGAWVAVTNSLSWTALWLGLAVMFWVAGFDIIYACQDYESDMKEPGLHSIPKAMGIKRSLEFARRVHGWAMVFFVLWWFAATPPLGFLSFLGLIGIIVLIARQHSLVRPNDLTRVNEAFFHCNAVISLGMMVVVMMDV